MRSESLQATEDASLAIAKTKKRVTLDSMVDKIQRCEYINPESLPHMTICVMRMENGFAVVGQSAPADPKNYDKEHGQKLAYENCIRQLWPLEAYSLLNQ